MPRGHKPIHGLCGTKIYTVWVCMIGRCYNPRNAKFHRYGGRGVKVCDRWRNSAAAFLEDMGQPPSKKHSLDRFPDTDGEYEPSNCRWATAKQQQGNRTNNSMIEVNGQRIRMIEAAESAGIPANIVRGRIAAGWSAMLALSIPVNGRRNAAKTFEIDGESLTLLEWSKVSGIPRSSISSRLGIGWPLREAVFLPLGSQPYYHTSKKKNHLVAFNGQTLSLTQWSKITGVKAPTIRARLKRGLSPEQAFAK